MAQIGFIGYGVVGQTTANGFRRMHSISFHDKNKPSDSFEKVAEFSEFIFLCLPTPMTADASCIDLTIMEEAVERIAPLVARTSKVLIIRSTVIPGTTARLAKSYPGVNFVMNPEFLREKSADWDFLNADRVVIGATDRGVGRRVEGLYRSIMPQTPIYVTDPTAAEVVKYAANTFLSMKVIFANEMADLCERLRVDYGDVKTMIAADKRIGDSHLDVTPERGFGGKCFPKDIVALLGLAEELGVELSLLIKTWEKNLKIRSVQDWKEIEGAVSLRAKTDISATPKKLRVYSKTS